MFCVNFVYCDSNRSVSVLYDPVIWYNELTVKISLVF